MKASPRILFLNRFYWPEEPATAQLLTDLAENLAAAGTANVAIITSAPRDAGLPATEVRHGVAIRRIRVPRLGGRGALARAIDWVGFSLGALWRVWRDVRPEDTLVLLTDPPLLAAVAGPLARRRGARVIHYVQDIYPELAEVINGSRGLGWLRRLRDRAWRQADACVVLGEDMAGLLARQGVAPQRIARVPNWAPHGLAPAPSATVAALREKWGLTHKFVVAYSGNLGRVHDLDPVLDLAGELRTSPEFAFVFIGHGAQLPRLQARVQAEGLPNVTFIPFQARSDLAASLGVGDVHLVTLLPGCEALVFPSKLYGIAAVGRPVLFIGPPGSALAREIAATGIGRAFARDQVVGMAQQLRDWHDRPETLAGAARQALEFARRNGGVQHAVAAWQHIINRVRL